ncbi:uncharacterized protein Z520_08716 [Fonsecaea multimorphosa CBS 102226]|uniref:Uncharacterized protein n=1 Tax=Fonsecaea multimorphosa CBS 102226 TaxID=1442371 RepID=A0A0D2IET2_9EURO|nr:uncharacterized protein Z520_08716 [Fonsecaea multimorphosa CBS 102226]KIX95596.1 hypothetical protein Z520_08716 [Fonsecaea multimorphosa CBS 102226]
MRIATREVEETMTVTVIAVIGGGTPDLGVLIDATVTATETETEIVTEIAMPTVAETVP